MINTLKLLCSVKFDEEGKINTKLSPSLEKVSEALNVNVESLIDETMETFKLKIIEWILDNKNGTEGYKMISHISNNRTHYLPKLLSKVEPIYLSGKYIVIRDGQTSWIVEETTEGQALADYYAEFTRFGESQKAIRDGSSWAEMIGTLHRDGIHGFDSPVVEWAYEHGISYNDIPTWLICDMDEEDLEEWRENKLMELEQSLTTYLPCIEECNLLLELQYHKNQP